MQVSDTVSFLFPAPAYFIIALLVSDKISACNVAGMPALGISFGGFCFCNLMIIEVD
jgi:hypothetical protein